jgi:prophage antirepressor-like protein
MSCYNEYKVFLNWVNSQEIQAQRDRNTRAQLDDKVNKIVKRFREDELALLSRKEGKKFVFKTEDISYHLSVYGTSDKPYFKGSEIASFLGYEKPPNAIKRHVKEKYKFRVGELLENTRSLNQGPLFFGLDIINMMHPQTILITENGLYQLIMSSELPLAEKFQEWVYEEVLPSIRKKGEYKPNFKINPNFHIEEHSNNWLMKD